MLSLSVNTLGLNPLFFSSNNNNNNRQLLKLTKPKPTSISASLNPSPFIPSKPEPLQQQFYQPFRPPPPPVPSKFTSLDTAGRIEVLANRLGLWFEFAPLITSLIQEGFTPSSIEEATGISGVEQNRIIVAAQVRESLVQSNADPQIVSSFDTSGAELLYEIRLLSATQRSASALYIIENRLDGKGAQELARAMKDFPRRKGEKGWESFDYTLPGDCLAFMYYRQSREHRNPSEQRTSWLEQALGVAVTENAKKSILEELKGDDVDGKEGGEDEIVRGVRVPVVRLKIGEVAEASSVVVLPVCKAEGREVLEAPLECRSEGEFGVVVAEKEWERWVVLPGWDPVMSLVGRGGVVVSFVDASVLPWKVNRDYKEEPILVVVDRSSKEVNADDGFYLAAVGDDGSLRVERGLALKNIGVKESFGTVVLVVRPPKEDTDGQLSDEEWD